MRFTITQIKDRSEQQWRAYCRATGVKIYADSKEELWMTLRKELEVTRHYVRKGKWIVE